MSHLKVKVKVWVSRAILPPNHGCIASHQTHNFKVLWVINTSVVTTVVDSFPQASDGRSHHVLFSFSDQRNSAYNGRLEFPRGQVERLMKRCHSLLLPSRGPARTSRAPPGGVASSPGWACLCQGGCATWPRRPCVWAPGGCSRPRPLTSPTTCCAWQGWDPTGWGPSGACPTSSPCSCPSSPTGAALDRRTSR